MIPLPPQNWGRIVVSHMRTILLLAALIPAIAAAKGGPTCATVPGVLYGVTLGPVHSYPSGLRDGLRREGTAEFIPNLGFESIEGQADGITYPRIMAFFDRGAFISVIAVGRIAAEKDHGFAHIVAMVEAAANSTPKLTPGHASFQCEESISLSVAATKWDNDPAVEVYIVNVEAKKKANAYITEYCSHPQHWWHQGACKK